MRTNWPQGGGAIWSVRGDSKVNEGLWEGTCEGTNAGNIKGDNIGRVRNA